MSNPVIVSFNLIDAMPELQLIDLLMQASKRFDDDLSADEKDRAVRYFKAWHEAQPKKTNPTGYKR